ncbi:hypothetical protein [Dokdonella sp.]|uniref:hypothetical protein n=1 Tax=Dokdonella sp. TaxID=2291710 RepID=UPI001B020D99|nr:hypothetical protein [Dokdonella sp.]MBO9661964.1 hypothetical protein [Dokdonella sp.]
MSFLRRALVLLASHAGLVAAATRAWLGAAPRATSLQGCIDAAADGGRIESATDEPITQNLAMRGRRLMLTAAGYAPRFVGARVTADDGSGGVGEIELRLTASAWKTQGHGTRIAGRDPTAVFLGRFHLRRVGALRRARLRQWRGRQRRMPRPTVRRRLRLRAGPRAPNPVRGLRRKAYGNGWVSGKPCTRMPDTLLPTS